MKIDEAIKVPISKWGMTIWSQEFKTIPIDQIPERIAYRQQWQPYGYNYAILNRETATLHIYKMKDYK